jgi:REP element-mobilizing transposase RayT
MPRLARVELFAADEVAVVHVMNRVVRRCFLLGDDAVTGKNYDHRKQWIENELQKLAGAMGIDLLGFSILSNHFDLILRSRPDVVASWDDTEVARRWLLACPRRKNEDGSAAEPIECELNSIRHDPDRLAQIRLRLSDISWWMRLLCQTIAMRANREDEETGKFWQSRYRAVRLMDEESLLACAAYVDLNPIRAALAETLEASDHTSVKRRIEAERAQAGTASDEQGRIEPTGDRQTAAAPSRNASRAADRFLAPLELDEHGGEPGPCANRSGRRCSDKGFLPVSVAAYLQLLDWTARQAMPGKQGSTPSDTPPMLERLRLSANTWCELVSNFGRLFSTVAGHPRIVDTTRSRHGHRRFHLTSRVRELLPVDP